MNVLETLHEATPIPHNTPNRFFRKCQITTQKKTEFMTSYSAIGAARYSSQKVLT